MLILKRWGSLILAAIPFACGYVLGTCIKIIKLIWAAFAEGFEQGGKL